MRAGDRVTFPYTWRSDYNEKGKKTGVMREHTTTIHATILLIEGKGVTVACEHSIARVDPAILTVTDPFPDGKTFDPWEFLATGKR